MAELSTQRKIAVARMARSFVMSARRLSGAGDIASVRRRGIQWELDLREGIDFSIFLLGGFELRTLRLYEQIIKPGDVVLDVGANIGAHTLPFAKIVGESGKVIAFEPTEFAFSKLIRNLERNPELKSRVTPLQMALLDSATTNLPDQIYSSWPLSSEEGLHEVHRGRLCGTKGATSNTLDEAVRSLALDRVDFIKLDVDGHEPSVLCGAMETLRKFKPTILIEWAPYLFDRGEGLFAKAFGALGEAGYRARVVAKRRSYPIDSAGPHVPVPAGASLNLLLGHTGS